MVNVKIEAEPASDQISDEVFTAPIRCWQYLGHYLGAQVTAISRQWHRSHSIGSLNPAHHMWGRGHLLPDNLIRIFCNTWKVNSWESREYNSCDFMNTETCYMTETLHGCDDKALKPLISSEFPNKPFFCSPAAILHNPPLWQQAEIISRDTLHKHTLPPLCWPGHIYFHDKYELSIHFKNEN